MFVTRKRSPKGNRFVSLRDANGALRFLPANEPTYISKVRFFEKLAFAHKLLSSASVSRNVKTLREEHSKEIKGKIEGGFARNK